MNINLDDPKLTAYALDELAGAEKAEMETAVASSPETQEFVRELRAFSCALTAPNTTPSATRIRSGKRTSCRCRRRMTRRASHAGSLWPRRFALFAVIGAIAIGTLKRGGFANLANGPRLAGGPPSAGRVELKSAAVDAVESPVPPIEEEPPPPPATSTEVSKFAVTQPRDVWPKRTAKVAAAPPAFGASAPGTFALPEAQQFQHCRLRSHSGQLLPRRREQPALDLLDRRRYGVVFQHSALHRERLSPAEGRGAGGENDQLFSYDYPQPNDDAPFSVNLDAASCPWEPAHRLIRIGWQGREMPNEKRPARNLVFLLDVSGSMEPANRLPLVKQAMRLLVEKLGENDRVAIVVHAGASGLALPSTTGDRKKQILTALENLQAGGSTNGAQGIELADQMAAEHFIKGGVNRVIFATDGDFNVGTTSEGDLVRLIQEKAKGGIFLSVLGVGGRQPERLDDAEAGRHGERQLRLSRFARGSAQSAR